MGPTGLPSFATTNGGRSWSITLGLVAREGLDGVCARVELRALAEDVRLPAALDHAPVGLVAVHRDRHAAAAARRCARRSRAVLISSRRSRALDVLERGGLAARRGRRAARGCARAGRPLRGAAGAWPSGDRCGECTLPSESRPMKCSVRRAALHVATISLARRRAANIAPLVIASVTSAAPCVKMRPAPSALWPTSVLPMSASDGMPTAVPCALSSVLGTSEQPIQRRRARRGDGVAHLALGDAEAVEHDGDDRTLDGLERGALVQHGLLRNSFPRRFSASFVHIETPTGVLARSRALPA